MSTQIPTTDRLKALGFVTAAYEMDEHKKLATVELREKLRVAFEFYRVVEPQHIERFNEQLKKKTKRVRLWTEKSDYGERKFHKQTTWMELKFCTIHSYSAAPPADVLDKLEEAKNRGCFDNFEIATLGLASHHTVRTKYPDPILFGRINGSQNRYFIAQWDDDVKIEDILSEEEG